MSKLVGYLRISPTEVMWLHATKGWKSVDRMKIEYGEKERGFVRVLPRKESKQTQLSEEHMEKARKRHAWYRKKLAWDALRKSLGQAA